MLKKLAKEEKILLHGDTIEVSLEIMSGACVDRDCYQQPFICISLLPSDQGWNRWWRCCIHLRDVAWGRTWLSGHRSGSTRKVRGPAERCEGLTRDGSLLARGFLCWGTASLGLPPLLQGRLLALLLSLQSPFPKPPHVSDWQGERDNFIPFFALVSVC